MSSRTESIENSTDGVDGNSHSLKTLSLFSAGISKGKLNLINDYLLPGSVLDIGCGNGIYGLYVKSLDRELLQIDLADRRDARAKHLSFAVMDAQNLCIAGDSFSNVLAFDIMEHLEEDEKFLQDVRSICDNRLFLSVPNSDDEQIASIGLTHIHHKDKTHKREYSRQQLEGLLARNGYRILCIKPNIAKGITRFPSILAKRSRISRLAARFVSFQCKVFLEMGLFENSIIGDWYCVAEKY